MPHQPTTKKPTVLHSNVANKPLLAPNGKVSNLTQQQWHLVRTKAFKAWFGDWENSPEDASKVIDDNGDPLVVYHGTNKMFNAFSEKYAGNNTNENGFLGFFFTPDKTLAEDFTRYRWSIGEKSKLKKNSRIILSYLSIKNPKIIQAREFMLLPSAKNFKINCIEGGFDGVIIEEFTQDDIETYVRLWGSNGVKEFLQNQYVAFFPNQIKLADGANTTFDNNSADINFDKGGNVESEPSLFMGEFSLLDREDSLPVDWISVPNTERRKGLAKEMLITEMQELKKDGINYIEVATTPDGTKFFTSLENAGVLINVELSSLTKDKQILKNARDLDLHVYTLATEYFARGGTIKNNTMAKKKVTEQELENSHAGGALVGTRREGQAIIHNKGTMGGYLTGKLHKNGGIKATVAGSGQPLEMQGGEVVITAPAVDDKKKQEFNGKMMTNREILSTINVQGGGVSFAKGGDVPDGIMCTGKKYTYGGKLMTDKDIVSGCGCKHSMDGGGEIKVDRYSTRNEKFIALGGKNKQEFIDKPVGGINS